jgi:hypothetical protein
LPTYSRDVPGTFPTYSRHKNGIGGSGTISFPDTSRFVSDTAFTLGFPIRSRQLSGRNSRGGTVHVYRINWIPWKRLWCILESNLLLYVIFSRMEEVKETLRLPTPKKIYSQLPAVIDKTVNFLFQSSLSNQWKRKSN